MFPARLHGSGSGLLSSAISDIRSRTYGVVREAHAPGPYTSHNHEALTPVPYGSRNIENNSSLPLGIDRLSLPGSDKGGLSHAFIRSSSPTPWESQRGLTSGRHRNIADVGRGLPTGRIEIGSASKSAIVTNTTVEIPVPDRVFGSVCGENGSNLGIIQQISGAKVIAHHPLPGAASGTVIISGTPEQTQLAQNLLQAFILSEPAKAVLRQL